MAHRMRVKPTVGDLLVIAAVCLLALLMFLIPVFANRSASYVRVTTEFGETSFLISLDGDFSRTIESAGYALTVTISNGTVCVSDYLLRSCLCQQRNDFSRRRGYYLRACGRDGGDPFGWGGGGLCHRLIAK